MIAKRKIQEIGLGDSLLAEALRKSWSRETSYDPTGWSANNPAWGQCAVTALVLQDCLSGNLLVGKINGIEHYWNLLPDHTELDLTRQQFGCIRSASPPYRVDRAFVLSFANTSDRYKRLLSRVQVELQKANPTDREEKAD